MTIAIASADDVPVEFTGNGLLIEALARRGAAAQEVPWRADVDWDAYSLVVIRSTWDYSQHHGRFLEWVRGLRVPVLNDPELVVWNSDKRYLGDLAAAGIPTVPTVFVGPDEPAPALTGEVVIKPSVSAGARLTGRFGPASYGPAAGLLQDIRASGRTAMVQPFQPSIDSRGETAVVLIDGRISHTLRKGQVLRPDEVAPTAAPGAPAAVMTDPGLVHRCDAEPAETALADRVLARVVARFATVPLYLRVDMLAGADGMPVLLELEAVEPNLYLHLADGAADALAGAIIGRLTR